MDILKMIAELRGEQEHLEEAILVIERLVMGQGKRRGRPPKWMAQGQTAVVPTTGARKRRVFSAATRRKMAEAQKKRWAVKKAQEKAA